MLSKKPGMNRIEHVKTATHINQGGWICVQRPWKLGFPDKLPNNYFRAEEQMRKRESELAKNGKLDDYDKKITNLVERGAARILSPEEERISNKRTSLVLRLSNSVTTGQEFLKTSFGF